MWDYAKVIIFLYLFSLSAILYAYSRLSYIKYAENIIYCINQNFFTHHMPIKSVKYMKFFYFNPTNIITFAP